MPDEILRDLERDVVALKVSNAELAGELRNLRGTVDKLDAAVNNLTETLNRGKGAMWGIMLIAGSLGASLTTIVKQLMGVT